jgi:hypothetical protein
MFFFQFFLMLNVQNALRHLLQFQQPMPQEEEIDALCDMHDVATDSISMQPTSDCMQCLDKYACCQVT